MEEAHFQLLMKEYEKAIKLYTKIIESNDQNRTKATLMRGIAYNQSGKEGNEKEAVKDLEAVKAEYNQQNIYKIELAKAYFNNKQYKKAIEAFERCQDKTRERWIRKATKELKEEELNNKKEKEVKKETKKKKTPFSKVYYNHFQMGTELVINVLGLRNIPKEQRKVTSTEKDKITMEMTMGEEKWKKEFDLYKPYKNYSVRHTTAKTAITLEVEDPETWPVLEKGEEKKETTKIYSSKLQPDDWDKMEAQERKRLEEEKPEGDAALNVMFQKIYAQGTPETKMAMKKSYIESNGTVLSTDWGDVGSKKIKPAPPPGMEVKSYQT